MKIYQQPIHDSWGYNQQLLFVIMTVNNRTTKMTDYTNDGIPWWIYPESPHVRMVYEFSTT